MGKSSATTSARRTGDSATLARTGRKSIMRQGAARRGCLSKARILVARNIRGIQQQAGVARSAKGVGIAIYDNDIALPMAYVNQLAMVLTQRVLKRRTVKVEVAEAAYRIAILGEAPEPIIEALRKGSHARAPADVSPNTED